MSRRFVTAILATALLALPAKAFPARDAGALELLAAASESPEPDAVRLERDLRALGPQAIPQLFTILAEGAFSRRDEKLFLTAELDGAVLGALVGQPLGPLRDQLEALAAANAPETRRLAGMRILALAGGEAELELLIHIASPPAEEKGVPRPRRNAFEDALGQMLERAPDGMWTLRSLFGQTEDSLLAPIVRRVGALDSADALHVLSSVLTRVREADSVVLVEIARLGVVVAHPVEDFVLSNVRFQLGGENPAAVRLAMQALGTLEDYDSIPTLIECLDQRDQNLRTTAGDALRQITARRYRSDFRAWDNWYRDEMRWWSQDSADRFDDLGAQDSTVALRAVLDIARRSVFRHELAEALTDCLQRDETDLVVLTCSTLGQLRSAVVVGDLVPLLDRDDPRISAAAWSSLVKITGWNLPPDSERWRTLQ